MEAMDCIIENIKKEVRRPTYEDLLDLIRKLEERINELEEENRLLKKNFMERVLNARK